MPATATIATRAITVETGADFVYFDLGFDVALDETREIYFLVWLRSDHIRVWADDLLLYPKSS